MKLLTSFTLTLVVCVAAASELAAQATPSQLPELRQATTPQYAGTFHARTGLVRDAATSRFGPELIYNNSILQNYYSVPGAEQEWIDEGVLLDRNQNGIEQVNGINFTYCSTVADANQNGVSSTYRLYSENVYCAGPQGWPTSDCAYKITGLPGGDANGIVQCWTVDVNLSGGFECDLNARPSTGLFGWSNAFDQDDTGPWLAEGGLGTLDSFVWFDPTAGAGNEFQGCFFWGCGPLCPWESFATRLYGNPNEVFSLPVGVDDPGRDLYLQVNNAVFGGGNASLTVRELDGSIYDKRTRLLASTNLNLSGYQTPGVGGIYLGLGAGLVYDEYSPSGSHQLFNVPRQGTYYLQAVRESMSNVPSRLTNVIQVNVQ